MKKLILLLVAILTMTFALSGCKDGVSPLSNVEGEVNELSNGTFAVEKGDYLYFVNGIGDSKANNEMGNVEKGALLRVKISEIGKDGANVETVIPKLMNTGSFVSGIYIFGDTVYYATPYDGKDKTSTVRNDYTEFRTFDLKTAKSGEILYETKTVSKYSFVSVGGNVYLTYQTTHTDGDDKEVKTYNVYDMKGEKVFSVDGYGELLVPANNVGKVYYTKTAYSQELKQDEDFNEIYEYVVGSKQASVVFSGCGTNALIRDGRNTDDYKAKILPYSDTMGVKTTLIKNTGSLLVFKIASNDINLSSYYYALDLTKQAVKSNLVMLGESNTYTDAAITVNSYYKSISEIYYVENSTYLKGLVKFNYENKSDAFHGRELVSSDAEGYNIAYEQGGYLYLNGTEGDYYRINLQDKELKKINAVGAKSLTDWFAPRVIGDKFVCVYAETIYQNYLYAIDMADETHLDTYEELDRAKVLTLSKTIVGKMTEADKTSFETQVDTDYPEEE